MKKLLIAIVICVLGVVPVAQTSAATAGSGPSASADTGPALPIEVTSLRTRTTDTYVQNGIYTLDAYSHSVNWRDSSGQWQRIDNTLIPTTRPGYAFTNRANSYAVSFPADLGSGPIRVETAAGWIGFAFTGLSGAGTVSGNTDTYAIPGGRVAFTVGSDQMKESITLQGPSTPSSFQYAVSMSSGLSVARGSDGAITFKDSAGNPQFGFAPPFMRDAAGAVSRAISFTLTQGAGSTTVTVTPDTAWLSSSTRQWPVVIDPSVSTGTFYDSQDCYLYSANPTTSYCGGTYLEEGSDGNLQPGLNRTMVQFNLSAIPTTAVILSTDLQLWLQIMGSHPFTPHLDIHQITHSWTTHATWNTYDGTNAWTAPGGDFSSAIAGQNTTCTATGGFCDWYINSLVQGWVNKSITNDGLLIQAESESTSPLQYFYSSIENADGPHLTIQYQTAALGIQSFYPMINHRLTDHMSVAVNVANGNFMVLEQDLNMPGDGLPLTVSRIFNNIAPAGANQFGNRWLMDGGADVSRMLFPDGSFGYVMPTGYFAHFTGSAPAGLDAVAHGAGGPLTFDQSHDTYSFDAYGRLATHADQSGNTITYNYDSSGRLSTITDTQGQATALSYGSPVSTKLISQITDPAGRTYGYSYDSKQNLTSYTDPGAGVTTFAYDTNGNLTRITDPDGNQTRMAYNAGRQVTSLTYVTNTSTGAGATYGFSYSPGSTRVTDPDGNSTAYSYSTATLDGLVSSTTDPLSQVAHESWTTDNHPASHQLPSGSTWSYTYDGSGGITRKVFPTGATLQATYTNSDPVTETDAQGNQTKYTYDGDHRVLSSTDALGGTTSYTYNGDGTEATRTDANGNTTTYTYSHGLVTEVTPPSGTSLKGSSYTYDSYNLVATMTDGNGNVTTYTHDAMGRLTEVLYDDGNYVSYTYDGDGNVTGMRELGTVTGTTTYSYDSLNRVLSVAYPYGSLLADGNSVEYAYDGVGNLTSKTDITGQTTFGYDHDERLTSVTDPWGGISNLAYNADSEMTRITFPGAAVYEDLSYDSGGHLTEIKGALSAGGSNLTDYTYDYANPATNKQTDMRYSATANGTSLTYAYDAADRLTTATGSDGSSYVYAYDRVGNMTSEELDGTTTTMSYDTANQLTGLSGGLSGTLTYDSNGNETASGSGIDFAYDAAGQATSVGGVAMSYSGVGETERISAGGSYFQYDQTGPSVAGVSDVVDTPSGRPLEERVNGATYYYLTDGLGSVTAVVDNSGNVVDQYSYDPYGGTNVVKQEVVNPLGYIGSVRDATTGLYKVGARYYNPAVARFTQSDPVACPLSQGNGTYLYAADDPVNMADPSGDYPCRVVYHINEGPAEENAWLYWTCFAGCTVAGVSKSLADDVIQLLAKIAPDIGAKAIQSIVAGISCEGLCHLLTDSHPHLKFVGELDCSTAQ